MLILTDFVVMSKIREKLFWKGNRIICHLRWMVALNVFQRENKKAERFLRNSEKTHYPACAGCKKPLRLIFALLVNFHDAKNRFA